LLNKPLQGYAKAANAIRLEHSESPRLETRASNSLLALEQTTRLTGGYDYKSDYIWRCTGQSRTSSHLPILRRF